MKSSKKAPVKREMDKFLTELAKIKPSIEKLDPKERDNKVLELRNKHLPKEEIKRLTAPVLPGPPEFVARQKKLLERQKQLEPHLKTLSYSDRCAELESLKKLIMKE